MDFLNLNNREKELKERTSQAKDENAIKLLDSLFVVRSVYEERFKEFSQFIANKWNYNQHRKVKGTFEETVASVLKNSSKLNRTYSKVYSQLKEWNTDLSDIPQELNYLERLN